jgi:hypothetical protein
MPKILYYNLHQALAFDDILMFRDRGWEVFPLGAYFPGAAPTDPFRPSLSVPADAELLAQFHADTCVFDPADRSRTVLTKAFVARFDVVCVVHSIDFIASHWDVLSVRPVIWRTVGQGMGSLDLQALPLRRQGLRIVRWSQTEQQAPGYSGHDAIIRCSKDTRLYQPWLGGDNRFVFTCSNGFSIRYPNEYRFFAQAVQDMPYVIAGDANPGLKNATGILDFMKLLAFYRVASAYFYCHGSEVPYTLNFAEAWMTGTPVVALSKTAQIPGHDTRYNEVADLIENGETGFTVDTPEEAHAVLRRLLDEPGLARQIAEKARRQATDIFGHEVIARQWSDFLSRLV